VSLKNNLTPVSKAVTECRPVRLRLDPISYENLRQQVLRRDRWRCQTCGGMSNLEVHHKEFRIDTA